MKAREIKIDIASLYNYMAYIRQEGVNSNISLNEFIRRKRNIKEDIIVSFSKIQFSEEDSIDLSGANLSGCNLDGVEFSGKHVILKDVDLRGASLNGSKFTDYINLAGANLGAIVLSNKVFEDCQLANTKYDPTNPKIALISPTEEQIQTYLASNKKQSLNEYLSINSPYPKDFKIIADLSKMTIDERFSGANLNGANLEEAVITGEIKNLSLRDCYTHKTKFRSCELIEPDLRGTSLATNSMFGWGFEAATFEGKVKLTDPKFSFGSYNLDTKQNVNKYTYGSSNLDIKKNIDKAQSVGLIPAEGPYDLTIEGKPLFDSCYKKGSKGELQKYVKCNREDLEAYLSHCKQLINKTDKKQSFKDFIKKSKNIQEKDFIADFAGEDLSNLAKLNNLELRNMQFEQCNFSFSNLAGNNFNHAIFKECNFSGAKFSNEKSIFSWLQSTNPASLNHVTLKDCDLTYAIANDVNASESTFTNVNGINLVAAKLNISEATFSGNSMLGAWLANLNASKLKQSRNFYGEITSPNNFAYADCRMGKFHEADCDGNHFIHTNLNRAELKKTQANYSNFNNANFSAAQIDNTECRYANFAKANIELANLKKVNVYGANFAGVRGTPYSIEEINWSEALQSKEVVALAKQQATQEYNKKRRNYYDKWAIVLTLGLTSLEAAAYTILSYSSPVVATILITNPIVTTAASIFTTAIVLDRAIAHFAPNPAKLSHYANKIPVIGKPLGEWLLKQDLSNGLGITSSLSNIFGANNLFQKRSDISLLQKEKEGLTKEEQKYNQLHDKIVSYEKTIKEVSKARTIDKAIELPPLVIGQESAKSNKSSLENILDMGSNFVDGLNSKLSTSSSQTSSKTTNKTSKEPSSPDTVIASHSPKNTTSKEGSFAQKISLERSRNIDTNHKASKDNADKNKTKEPHRIKNHKVKIKHPKPSHLLDAEEKHSHQQMSIR